MPTLMENLTDYEMLRKAFGNEYFIFRRIKNKMPLDSGQKQQLNKLIDDRNHFEILHLVKSLRKG